MTRASAWIAPATTLRVNDREYDLVLDARTATADDRPADALLLAVRDREHDERALDPLVLGVLRSALEQRVTREARDRGRFPAHLVS